MGGKHLNIFVISPISSTSSLLPSLFYGTTLILVVLVVNAAAELQTDKTALLDFINSFPHLNNTLNWNPNNNISSICTNWTGVTCNPAQSHVTALQLPYLGLTGPIPANTLSFLTGLQLLNLSANQISGELPISDLSTLKNLSVIDLSSNNFTGPLLLLNLSVWNNLSVVNLSNNRFNGSIPRSIYHLFSLNLANNSFSGKIPDDLDLPHRLQYLNLSFNKLTGLVSKSLIQRFTWSSFSGNEDVVIDSSLSSSGSLALPSPPSSSTSQSKKRRNEEDESGGRIGKRWLLVIVIASSAVGLVAFSVLLVLTFCCYSRTIKKEGGGKFMKGDVMSPGRGIQRSGDEKSGGGGRLVFFEGCTYGVFDLEDLLGASAEVLGKGTFGMSYKAILEDGSVVVVKRLKEVNVGRKEFEQMMSVIGGIKHKNVVEVKGYYYSRDEKLIVGDHCRLGSVSDLLHENRGQEGRVALDWETRLKIATGAARGIAHIHTCKTTNSNIKLVHGNIRSSNIFLNSIHGFGCVSDFGLAQIMSPVGLPVSRSVGYFAPEVTDTRKPTQSSDVYSFGVFLLELLTGKSPVHVATCGGGGEEEMVHLVRWAHAMVREEWTGEVFDSELVRRCTGTGVEEEMVELLRIGMACVAMEADQRPEMVEVVRMIDGVRQIDSGSRSSDSARE